MALGLFFDPDNPVAREFGDAEALRIGDFFLSRIFAPLFCLRKVLHRRAVAFFVDVIAQDHADFVSRGKVRG